MIELSNITKSYRMGQVDLSVLNGVTVSVNQGELIAIMGPSGSGKSTLMNIIGCLDRPTSGVYRFENREISTLSDDELASVRNSKLGFVFQTFNLPPALLRAQERRSAAHLQRDPRPAAARARHAAAARRSGLADRMHHKPTELSGGQQQRVAIARALVNNPPVLLADEPTGNLDSRSGEDILNILTGLNDQGVTMIIVTHDQSVAARCKRIIRLKDGQIVKRMRAKDFRLLCHKGHE